MDPKQDSPFGLLHVFVNAVTCAVLLLWATRRNPQVGDTRRDRWGADRSEQHRVGGHAAARVSLNIQQRVFKRGRPVRGAVAFEWERQNPIPLPGLGG